jgi:hypothetical membrane protein
VKKTEREKVTIQLDRLQLAGTLILLAGMQFVIGAHIAEATYPGYNVNQNYLSDLGATVRYTSNGVTIVIQQPASAIFTVMLMAMGVLILGAAYLMFPLVKSRRTVVFMGLFGIAALGIGIFSEVFTLIHGIFSLLAFFTGGLAAIFSFKLTKRPMNYVSVILGVTVLVAMVLLELASLDQILPEMGFAAGAPLQTPIGIGGLERMIAYPLMLWFVMFGASLISAPETVIK